MWTSDLRDRMDNNRDRMDLRDRGPKGGARRRGGPGGATESARGSAGAAPRRGSATQLTRGAGRLSSSPHRSAAPVLPPRPESCDPQEPGPDLEGVDEPPTLHPALDRAPLPRTRDLPQQGWFAARPRPRPPPRTTPPPRNAWVAGGRGGDGGQGRSGAWN